MVTDVDDIPAGVNFGTYIQESLRQCAVMLVIIGQQWLDTQAADGGRRLDDPKDWVRIEVETALSLGLTIIPLLVEGVRVPKAADLPASLQELAQINSLNVRDDPDFTRDMERVIGAVERVFATRPSSGIFGRRGSAPPTEEARGAQKTPAATASPAPAAVPSRVQTTAAMQEKPPRSAEGTGKSRSRLLLFAGLAAAVIVIALAELLPPNVQRIAGLVGKSATPTATLTATATVPAVAFPYHADAPGPDCDHGTAQWSRSGFPTQLACVNNALRLKVSAIAAVARTIWQISTATHLPSSCTISVQVSNLALTNSSFSFGEARFGVTLADSTPRFGVVTSGSSPTGYGYTAYRESSESQALGSGPLDPASKTTLAITVAPTAVTFAVNGSSIGSYSKLASENITEVYLEVQSGQADFSNFNVVAA